MAKIASPISNIKKLKCVYCSNINLLIIIDFSKKWEGKTNVAYCVRKAVKNMFGVVSVTGCGKKFSLEVEPRKMRHLRPL